MGTLFRREPFTLLLLLCCSCASADEARTHGAFAGTTSDVEEGCGDRIVYPTETEGAFGRVYRGRRFYADGNHLGHDVLLAEGDAVRAIGCGTVVVSRPADGYGTLAVVIEHHLSRPVRVQNGAGELMDVRSFLSIYGHLRPSASLDGGDDTGLVAGSHVEPGQVVGFVERRDRNGDGDEHVHIGIRLQSMADARATDPTAWFRGYDARPPATSQLRWFADPALFLAALRDDRGSAGEPEPSDAGVAGVDVPDTDAVSPDAGVAPEMPEDPPEDAGVPEAAPTESVPETCNGLDDDGDGSVDEDFLCPLGHMGDICVTTCGVNGYRVCEAPACSWGDVCHTFDEACDNALDDDCNGFTDCDDPACHDDPKCLVRDPEPASPPEPPATEPSTHELVIVAELGSEPVRALCHDLEPEIIFWDTVGAPVASGPGIERVVYPLSPLDRGYFAVTIRCGGRYLRFPVTDVGRTAAATGVFRSITIDGRELSDEEVLVCRDPWAPPIEDGSQPIRPMVPLVDALWWSCPSSL